MKRYAIFADNENIGLGWKGHWCSMDDKEEALEYGHWLIEMHVGEPEAKADWVQVVDLETEEVLFQGTRQ